MSQAAGKYDKLGAAMSTLENVFYEDMDPSGESGSVSLNQVEQYFSVCGTRGNSFHRLMVSWFNEDLDPKQRKAFL